MRELAPRSTTRHGSPRVNAQVERLIQMLAALQAPGAPRLWELPPDVARRAADAMFVSTWNGGGPEMAEVHAIEIAGRRGAIPARLYVPRGAGRRSGALLYLHGGGWVIGSPDTHDRLTRELAAALGIRVVSPAYRLAPEHPYPQGLDDCVDAARWIGADGAAHGIDADRLLIGGDSAGGNLTAASLLRLRAEHDGPAFRGAIYIYGAFEMDAETPSRAAWGDRDLILSTKVMDWFKRLYLDGGGAADDPHVSPLRADLRGLPPAVLLVGTLDPLLSDSELFAAALERAGVPAELHLFEDGPHAFAQMFALDMARDAIERIAAFSRGRLYQ
jgi:acetyl esterase